LVCPCYDTTFLPGCQYAYEVFFIKTSGLSLCWPVRNRFSWPGDCFYS
jgi:hypothetical protein